MPNASNFVPKAIGSAWTSKSFAGPSTTPSERTVTSVPAIEEQLQQPREQAHDVEALRGEGDRLRTEQQRRTEGDRLRSEVEELRRTLEQRRADAP